MLETILVICQAVAAGFMAYGAYLAIDESLSHEQSQVFAQSKPLPEAGHAFGV
ncbi:MAG TPA: hypothetical protein VE935_19510 [Burkholderiales bacterium]|jgi:hypothetical protein|nr:hypothetical protein [Burkholderiales bacterium]